MLDDTVLTWIVDWDPGPRLDPLLAAAILFGPASVVLASASPIAVRLAASSLERLGRTAGRLFSISTAGSIFGTFVTAFWLVPELGTDQVLAIGAVTLVAAALIVALAVRLVPAAVALTAALAGAVVLAVSLAPDQQQELKGVAAQNWSPLYRLRENRTPGPLDPASIGALGEQFTVREARGDALPPAGRGRRQRLPLPPLRQLLPEWHVALEPVPHALPVHRLPRPRHCPQAERAERALHRPRRRLGAEADLPRLPARSKLQVVELDPEVVAAAYTWFALPHSPRLDVAVDDGRQWLTRHPQRWDVIVIDAFYADSIPFHLATHEFLNLVRERLAPGGVVVVNVIGSLTGSDSKLLRSLTKTYRIVVPDGAPLSRSTTASPIATPRTPAT